MSVSKNVLTQNCCTAVNAKLAMTLKKKKKKKIPTIFSKKLALVHPIVNVIPYCLKSRHESGSCSHRYFSVRNGAYCIEADFPIIVLTLASFQTVCVLRCSVQLW